jgi:TPP-dependent trihydroxycyclohexane-1,2-dione (THcHDO) dehydratase
MIQKAWRDYPTAMPVDEVMAMATSNACKALGLNVGRVEAGAFADLLIVDIENLNFLSPASFEENLLYSAHSECIDSVICDGSFIMLHSELVTAVQEHQKIHVCLFNNASFGCINNLQNGHGNATLCTELRYRGDDGEHSGTFMPIDFAKIAEGYGCKAFVIHTMAELYAAIEEGKKIQGIPVLYDIRVLPKSMTEGYGAWWRCGDAEVSENPKNVAAYEDHLSHERDARKY